MAFSVGGRGKTPFSWEPDPSEGLLFSITSADLFGILFGQMFDEK